MQRFNAKKFDDELQVVTAEVYAPGFPDSQGDFMCVREVQKMAYRFLAKGRMKNVDKMHDNKATDCSVVESFIARDDDTLFIPGAWVVSVHVPDKELWQKVKSGELNGFSLEGPVYVDEKYIELEVPEIITGTTGLGDSHVHLFEVKFNEDGEYLGGIT